MTTWTITFADTFINELRDEVDRILDQQRRLLYVGCSRAMRFLMVCGSNSHPSTFLNSLKTPYWHIQHLASPTKTAPRNKFLG